MSQPKYAYELFAEVLANMLILVGDVIVGGQLGFQSRIGDRVVRRKPCDWNPEFEVVVFERKLGTIIKVEGFNGKWTFRDAAGDGITYPHITPSQAAELVRGWPDVAPLGAGAHGRRRCQPCGVAADDGP